jgi:type IV secretion system protein VirB10
MSSNEQHPESHDDADRDDEDAGNGIAPLEGEAGIPSVVRPAGVNVSRKGIFAVVLLALSLVAVSAVSINRAMSSRKDSEEVSKRLGDRPASAGTGARRLDMTLPPAASASANRMIPAIIPTAEERRADPIPLRQQQPNRQAPEDAPVLLVSSRPATNTLGADSSGRRPQTTLPGSELPPVDAPLGDTRRNLETYQRQLQGVLDSVTKSNGALGGPTPASPGLATSVTDSAAPVEGLFDGEVQRSETPRVAAGLLGNRSLILPKGTAFTCALKTKLISAASGFVSCQVQRNVFGDDGRVLLVERGSHMDGEYRIAAVRPGTVRIPVLWTRIRTPNGVTVDVESPGSGPLGESGVDGFVDNRWPERIGAAMLLSLIDDSVKLAIEDRASTGTAGTGNTILLPSTTSSTSKLAEKMLDSTINIPPLIYQNQGGIVGIYVARDVDFSSVYELKAVQR